MVEGKCARSLSRLLCLSIASVAASSGLVLAQEQQTNQSQLEEIVVSATRRDESINRVPISITAFSSADMEDKDITKVEDLFRRTPGVTFTQNGDAGSTSISIRGIQSTGNAATTGVYIDDTPIQVRQLAGYSVQSNFYPQLIDLERVEVLRGPQGTLFGASAEGGAVRFITRDIDLDTPRFYARSEFGYNIDGGPTNGLALSGSLPIVEDRAAVSVQTTYQRDGGYIDRVASNGYTTEADANWHQNISARLALKYAVTDSLTLTPSVFYQRSERNDWDAYWPNVSDPANGTFVNADPAKAHFIGNFELPALKLQWNLGGVTLYSNTSYFKAWDVSPSDYGAYIPSLAGLTVTEVGYSQYITQTTPTILPTAGPQLLPNTFIEALFWDRQDVFVQEARVQSNGNGPLTWVAGVFFSHTRQWNRVVTVDPPAVWDPLVALMPPSLYAYYGTIPLSDGLYSYDSIDESIEKQIAGFGEASYEVLPGFKLTVGVRHQHTSFEYLNIANGPFAGGPSSGGGTERDNPTTPKYGMSYQIDPGNMVYATVAKGFRNGGANQPLPDACNQDLREYGITQGGYHPDTVWSYEVGAKDQLLNHHLSLDSSLFVINWRNIQQAIPLNNCGLSTTTNLGTARSQGGDIQAAALLTDHLTVNASVAYTQARFTQTILGDPDPQTGVRPILTRDGVYLGTAAGPPRPWWGDVGAEYRFTAFNLPVHVGLDYEYNGRAPFTSDLDPVEENYNARALRLGGYGQLDGALSVQWENFELNFYGKNLTNGAPTVLANRMLLSSLDLVDTNATITPLTIGVQGIYRFSGSH